MIASIHQPSASTFQLFDKLLLLSGGNSHYFGPAAGVQAHFESLGYPMPIHTNPAEFILNLMNTDFTSHQAAAMQRLENLQKGWTNSPPFLALTSNIQNVTTHASPLSASKAQKRSFSVVLLALVCRSFIKSYRDVVAYGIRIAMYMGLAIMMGTVWLRLHTEQSSIQPFINAIFFGSAFMSFMAVAYVPSFLEDRATFVKERANGLYGASAFMLSNFIIGLPYLCQ